MTEGWPGTILSTLGMGLTWAVGWALVGVLTGVATGFVPDGHPMQTMVDPWVALATPGFIGGVVFSVVLRIAERGRKFAELSLSRAAGWGAATGLILGSFPFVLGTPTDAYSLWTLAAAIVGGATLLCSISACGSLTLVRRVAATSRGG